MALINRISRLVKADFHAVLDQIEEPEQLLKQAIRDMEDELAETEQRVRLCVHDQEALAERKREIESTIDEIAAQLDLCFQSKKEALAKTQIRKKLEAERVLKRVVSKLDANTSYIDKQGKALDEHRATLESLRQKAELFSQRAPTHAENRSDYDDLAFLAREMSVSDDEVEIAFLREKDARSAS
ncbi:MAG: PspA/IM30 family protein [Woeseiaceae bacterium]|nr:PspA/IM30 family protein [Woeseiaceae bacterium]